LLTGGRFPNSPAALLEVQITTQDVTQKGTPDISIEARDFLAYIEVKVDASLGHKQLSRYREALLKSGRSQTSLTLLNRYPHPLPESERPDTEIRWFHIAQQLHGEIQSGAMASDPLSAYLIHQFLGYLQELKITIPQAHSRLSEGLDQYIVNHGKALTDTRIRDPQRLLKYAELRPVYDLMILLREALSITTDETGAKFRLYFDTGKHNGGWIGYNLNNMAYFVFLFISQPETLIFQTFNRVVDFSRWDQKVGYKRKLFGKWGWENKLDLLASEAKFFDLSQDAQLQWIRSFVQSSLEEVQKFSDAKP